MWRTGDWSAARGLRSAALSEGGARPTARAARGAARGIAAAKFGHDVIDWL